MGPEFTDKNISAFSDILFFILAFWSVFKFIWFSATKINKLWNEGTIENMSTLYGLQYLLPISQI